MSIRQRWQEASLHERWEGVGPERQRLDQEHRGLGESSQARRGPEDVVQGPIQTRFQAQIQVKRDKQTKTIESLDKRQGDAGNVVRVDRLQFARDRPRSWAIFWPNPAAIYLGNVRQSSHGACGEGFLSRVQFGQ